MKNKTNIKTRLVEFKTKFFRYQVISKKTNKSTGWTTKPVFKRLLFFLIFATIIIFIGVLDWSVTNSFGFQLFVRNIRNFFSFDSISTFSGKQNNWLLSLEFLWITIKTTAAGTFIGFVLAIITSSLSSNLISNKYVSYFQKGLILFIRSFPELIFINLFSLGFFPEMAVVMIFAWFSWLWLHKYFLEAIENLDRTAYDVSILEGNSKIKALRKEVIPRLSPRFWSLFLYSFEANLRWSSILSALGVLGIGTLINFAGSRDTTFSQLGIPIFIILLFMVLFEIFSLISKKYLFTSINKKIKSKNYKILAKTINFQVFIKAFLIAFLVIFTFYVFFSIEVNFTSILFVTDFLAAVFTPDWSVFDVTSSSYDLNPFLQILQLFQFSILTLFISSAFMFLLLYYAALNLRNKTTAITVRIFIIFIRLIPSVVFIFLINPLLNNAFTLLIVVVGFHSSSDLAKKAYEIIDNIDQELIKNLKFQGYSNRIIFFKYLLPTVKYDIIGLLIFEFEIGIRNAIVYSIFSNSELKIGHFINAHLDRLKYQPDKAMAYIWISTMTIFMVNVFTTYLRNRIKNKKTIWKLKV